SNQLGLSTHRFSILDFSDPALTEMSTLSLHDALPIFFVHAEIDCIGKLRYIPRGSILFIGRLDMNGNPAMCRPCEACLRLIMLQDRKSTRLNSSHVKISYAVFCL